MINSPLLTNPTNIEHLYQFSKQLQPLLDLKLKEILPMTLPGDDIITLRMMENPFLESSSTHTPFQNGTHSEAFMAELSSHPVHLLTKNGKTLPSAFIPFCAFKTDLLLLGERINGFKFPVCNKFTPTVLDGQLCYTLDINSHVPNIENLHGKQGELLLFLDYNQERSISLRMTRASNNSSDRFISMEKARLNIGQEAKILIHTLKPYVGFGGGSFSMSSLKQMSPTENFLKLSPSTKGCASEDQQECLMKSYLKEKLHSCQCIPWEFPQASNISEQRSRSSPVSSYKTKTSQSELNFSFSLI